MTNEQAVQQMSEALTVLVDNGQVDYMSAVGVIMSTPPSTDVRRIALDSFTPVANTPNSSMDVRQLVRGLNLEDPR